MARAGAALMTDVMTHTATAEDATITRCPDGVGVRGDTAFTRCPTGTNSPCETAQCTAACPCGAIFGFSTSHVVRLLLLVLSVQLARHATHTRNSNLAAPAAVQRRLRADIRRLRNGVRSTLSRVVVASTRTRTEKLKHSKHALEEEVAGCRTFVSCETNVPKREAS